MDEDLTDRRDRLDRERERDDREVRDLDLDLNRDRDLDLDLDLDRERERDRLFRDRDLLLPRDLDLEYERDQRERLRLLDRLYFLDLDKFLLDLRIKNFQSLIELQRKKFFFTKTKTIILIEHFSNI